MIDIEELRDDVELIAKAVRDIRDVGITDEALVHLIQQACPTITTRGPMYGRKPNKNIIRVVMDGMENLEAYVFGDDESSEA